MHFLFQKFGRLKNDAKLTLNPYAGKHYQLFIVNKAASQSLPLWHTFMLKKQQVIFTLKYYSLLSIRTSAIVSVAVVTK